MKLRRLILIPFLFTASVVFAQSRFELQQAIDGTFQAGQQGRLVVAGDLFGQARSFPNDVRIFAADGTQWPFFLHVPQPKADTETFGLEILNRSWVDGPERYLQFDVMVPSVGGKPPVHNRLKLDTAGRDFVRRVEIFSGNPDQPSGHMASGYLIDFANQRDARNRIIHYPDSDAPRLHVRIYPNAQAADETFGITSARVYYRTEKEVEREPVAFVDVDVDAREQEKGAQTRILDIKNTDRPVEFITFEVADKSYARSVSIHGRNNEHDAWRWVGGGEIHALAGDRVDTVKLRANCRFLKVQLHHHDDQPLDLQSIRLEAIPRYLVFEAATDGAATVFFRAWDINAPRYDLQGRIKKESIDALPVYRTLATEPNKAAAAQPWRKYSKLLGGLAVGAVSLLVVWIIVGMLRQQTSPTRDPGNRD